MNTTVAYGVAGGTLFAARRWVSLFLVLLLAKRVSRELALAVFKEALKAGWDHCR